MINRAVLFTEGAKYIADRAGAYWVLDEIAISQGNARVAAEEFQVWKLAIAQIKPPFSPATTATAG